MVEASSPIVVCLTPPGRGAIASVAVEGPGAMAAVEAHFRSCSGRPLAGFPPDRLVFGHFGPEPGEEVVARVRSAEAVEIHCHGGHAAVAMVEQTLVAQGCRSTSWSEWLRRHGRDEIAADAMVALAEAPTERTATILLDQYQGALDRAVKEICTAIKDQNFPIARQQLERLLARAPIGLHLIHPWRVVIAGEANVGKSTLLNAMLGYARAIVDPSAGTTRDLVTATTAIDGWPVELCDTAGLRVSSDPVELAGMQSARERLASADLVLVVFDSSQPWSAKDAAMLEKFPSGLVVHNKSDVSAAIGPDRPRGLATSAVEGKGLDSLLQAIAARLVPEPPSPGAAVPFTQPQVDVLRRASQALADGDTQIAYETLCRSPLLSGEG